MKRQPAALAALVVVAVLAGGCGIPRDEQPVLMPGGVVQLALAPSERAPSPALAGQATPDIDVALFLARGEHLVRAARRAPGPDLAGVLNLLLAGPDEAEFAAGLRSAISPQTSLRSAALQGDTAVVDLSGALVEVGGQEQILAVAQIVLTATAAPDVTQVRLLLEGQTVEVPRADGTLTSEALRAGDYQRLLSEAP